MSARPETRNPKPPVVSVITPTYNRAAYIGDAIESVLAQTYQDWELIIVNDGGTDETEAVIKPYRVGDPRIRYITQTNTGVSGARNRALREARGRYAAFLDDDDRWLPEKLARQVAYLEQHPEIGMCYARATPGFSPTSFPGLLRPFQSILPSTVVARREALVAIGGFNETPKIQEDYDCWLRLAQYWPLGHLNQQLSHSIKGRRRCLSGDTRQNHRVGIRVLEQLVLTHEHRDYHRMRIAYIGYLHYLLAREHYAVGAYGNAAKHFSRALWHDPLVGLRFGQPGERGWLLSRLAKSYAAVPISLVRRLLYVAR